MGIALPFGFAAGLLALPVLALYVLKMRRRDVVVGSIVLWTDAVRDLRANAPWQRLRPNVLLLLQLAALAGLVLALARPYVLRASTVHGDVVVLLDASAPMKATDAAGFANRFAAAKARVGALIDDLGADDVMSIVRMGRSPRVVIAQSADRAALRAALDSVGASDEPLDAAAALSLGAALVRGGHGGTLDVVTGAGTLLPQVQAGHALNLQVTRIGGRLRDLAIVAFASGFDDTGTLSAVARVANYGSRRAATNVELSVDGHLLDVQAHTIAAGGQVDLAWPNLPPGTRVLQARLSAPDDLADDNMAWATAPRQTARRVLLVTTENVFLATALSLDPTVRLTTMTPAAYVASGARRAAVPADLTIFDGYHPATLPRGNLLLVDPPRGQYSGFTSGAVARLAVAPEIVRDPVGLLRYVQAADVHIQAAHAITAEAWLRPTLAAGTLPLLLAGEEAGRRLAVLSFDLHDSDLPLQPDMPIMINNLLAWLAPGSMIPPNLSLRPGDALSILPVAGARAVEVRLPGGRRATLAPPFPPAPFAETNALGVYRLRQVAATGTREDLFAVNLFPASPNAGLDAAIPASGDPGATPPVRPTAAPQARGTPAALSGAPSGIPVDLSAIFAGLALVVLCAEWWVASHDR